MSDPRPNELGGMPTPTPNPLSAMVPPDQTGRPGGRRLRRWGCACLLIVISIFVVIPLAITAILDSGMGSAGIGGGYIRIGMDPGQCFDIPPEDMAQDLDEVDAGSWTVVDCERTHRGEGVFLGPFTSADAAYPSDTAFDAFYDRECVAAFRSYTGDDYADRDDVVMRWIVPAVDGWQAGDRLVMCYLTPADGQAISRSYRRPGWSPAATSSL